MAETTIWESIANTPWWMFVIFFYLVFIGFIATKPKMVSIKAVSIMPIVFLIFTIFSFITLLKIHLIHILICFAFAFIGMLCGWIHYNFLNITLVDRKTIQMPGSWGFLLLLLIFGATKYYYGYQLWITPELLTKPYFQYIMVSAYGIIGGVFIGRALFVRHLARRLG